MSQRLLWLAPVLFCSMVLAFSVIPYFKVKSLLCLAIGKRDLYEWALNDCIILSGVIRNIPGWFINGDDLMQDGYMKDGVNFDE